MYEFRFAEMVQNVAKRCAEVILPGENVLILSDTKVEDIVWRVFETAARLAGGKPVLSIMPPLERDYMDPPAPVVGAAEKADVIHYCASTALVHSQFGVRMIQGLKKKRINSDQIDARMLLEGGILADPKDIKAYQQRVQKYWDEGSKVHVTSALGTDVWIDIEGRSHFRGHTGVPHIQFPGGEAMIPPQEYTAEGTIVIDKCMHFLGSIKTPITLQIRKGRIESMEGGDEARAFRRWLQTHGDENGWRLCELAVGTNPKAIWMGSPRQDRFVLGSSHVGFGLNKDVGGAVDSNIHYDAIFSEPTIEVDGKVIIKEGEFVV